MRDEDVQERLDALNATRDELQDRIADLDSQRAIAAAETKSNRDAAMLVAQFAELFEQGAVDKQRRAARVLAIYLGGFCVEEDRTLTVRYPVDAAAQRKRRVPNRSMM